MKSRVFFSIMCFGLLASCLDDKGYTDIVNAKRSENGVVAFYGAEAAGITTFGVLPSASVQEFDVHVTFSFEAPASSDIDVTIQPDPSLIAAYNDDNDASFIALSSSDFILPAKATVMAGERDATFTIQVKNGDKLDIKSKYMLPLVVTDAQGYTIASNLNTAYVAFTVQNQYDGKYAYEGSITRNTATGPDLTLGGTFTKNPARDLATLGPNSVSFAPLWANGSGIAGIDGTFITVDPVSNLVTMAATGNPALKNTPGKENRYDPIAKKFYLSFDWGAAPNTRLTTVVLTYIGPR